MPKPKKSKTLLYPYRLGRIPLFIASESPQKEKTHPGGGKWGGVTIRGGFNQVDLNIRHEELWIKLLNLCMDKPEIYVDIYLNKAELRLLNELTEYKMTLLIPWHDGKKLKPKVKYGKEPEPDDTYPDALIKVKGQEYGKPPSRKTSVMLPRQFYYDKNGELMLKFKTCKLDGAVLEHLKGMFSKALYRFVMCHFDENVLINILTLKAVLAPESRTDNFVKSLKESLGFLEKMGILSEWSVNIEGKQGDRQVKWSKNKVSISSEEQVISSEKVPISSDKLPISSELTKTIPLLSNNINAL